MKERQLPCGTRAGAASNESLCAGAVTFQPTITKTYNTTNLLEDIKALYRLAGLKGQKVGCLSLSYRTEMCLLYLQAAYAAPKAALADCTMT